VRESGSDGKEGGLVEPVDIENKDEVGGKLGDNQNTPVGEKDEIPRDEAGEDFKGAAEGVGVGAQEVVDEALHVFKEMFLASEKDGRRLQR